MSWQASLPLPLSLRVSRLTGLPEAEVLKAPPTLPPTQRFVFDVRAARVCAAVSMRRLAWPRLLPHKLRLGVATRRPKWWHEQLGRCACVLTKMPPRPVPC